MLQFGGEGSGPGLFNPPGRIAVDRDGNIYVADCDTGRLQKFDPSGKFVWLANSVSGRSTRVTAVAADFAGHVYVSINQDIIKLAAEDGAVLAVFDDAVPDMFGDYKDMAVDLNNALYALSHKDLIKLSPDGAILAHWEDILGGMDKYADPGAIALDGNGKIYITSVNNQVYIFDQNGKFTDRFGQAGDTPGSIVSPRMIVVDGRGRAFIRDLPTFMPSLVRDMNPEQLVNVYDAGGVYMQTIRPDADKGAIVDITIDIEGHLYAITTKGLVLKFKVMV